MALIYRLYMCMLSGLLFCGHFWLWILSRSSTTPNIVVMFRFIGRSVEHIIVNKKMKKKIEIRISFISSSPSPSLRLLFSKCSESNWTKVRFTAWNMFLYKVDLIQTTQSQSSSNINNFECNVLSGCVDVVSSQIWYGNTDAENKQKKERAREGGG